jgi:hypothetical protein
MIDRSALKRTARQSMKGLKPSAYLVAAIYISIFYHIGRAYLCSDRDGPFFEYLAQHCPSTRI